MTYYYIYNNCLTLMFSLKAFWSNRRSCSSTSANYSFMVHSGLFLLIFVVATSIGSLWWFSRLNWEPTNNFRNIRDFWFLVVVYHFPLFFLEDVEVIIWGMEIDKRKLKKLKTLVFHKRIDTANFLCNKFTYNSHFELKG